ncbi:MAG: DivIVA domain-containing protein [Nitrospinaceae bacterium]
MRLSYLDVLEQCFHEKWRGYDKQEVDTFMHLVADDFKTMAEELERLKALGETQENRIRELESNGSVPVNGGGGSPGLPGKDLQVKVRRIIQQTREKADRHLQAVDEELKQLQRDVNRLRRDKKQLVESIKHSALSFVKEQTRRDRAPVTHETAHRAS